MVQGLCKTPSNQKQGSRTFVPPLPSLPQPAGGAARNLQASQILQRPQEKATPKQPGLQNYKYPLAHAHCDLRVAPGHDARPLRLRRPARPLVHRTREGGPVVPRKRKRNESAAATRSRFPRSLPHSASWLLRTAPTNPATAAAYLRETRNRVPHALATAARD